MSEQETVRDVAYRVFAEQVYRLIDVAREVNPSAWSLQSNGMSMYLNVGSINHVGFDGRKTLWIVVDNALVLADRRESLVEYATSYQYAGNPTFMRLAVPGDKVEGLLTGLGDAYEAPVRASAGHFKVNQRWKWHDFDIAAKLGEIGGQMTPVPPYADDLRALRAQEDFPSSPESLLRYWKISPGEGAHKWDIFRDRSVIAVRFSDRLSDLSSYPDDQQTFVAMARSNLEVSGAAGKCLWQLSKQMVIGDRVLAYGNQTVLGYGTVVGDYQLIDDDFDYMHRRNVVWESLTPRQASVLSQPLQNKLSRRSTLFELTAEEFADATSENEGQSEQRSDSTSEVATVDPLSTIQRQFVAEGLYYSEEQIAAFYTALQTKGFVVLSGISGTGKSKIAAGFVEMLPSVVVGSLAPTPDTVGMVHLSVKPYMQRYKRVILPNRYVDLLPPMEVGSQHEITISLGAVRGEGRIEHRAHSGSNILVLYFRGAIGRAIAELELGTRLFLRPAFDEEGDSLVAVDLLLSEDLTASHDGAAPAIPHHLFLSVRPDWRDSTSLLGYYNPLTQTYEWTDFLRFLIRAGENFDGPEDERIAWFVILDEMNLAHVEYYFADLLSVIESGRDEKGWTREPLRLSYPEVLDDDDVPARELKLPPNLYIIGTVNMDETTHAFSPKVLDRAFTIELTDVDFADYPPPMNAGSGALSDGEKTALLTAFSRNGRFARIDKTEISKFVGRFPEVRDQLQALNEVLMPYRMHFGYRVFDEIVQYLAINDENGMAEFADAFDQAVFMKVLPKFTGSRARLQSPLRGVFAWALDPDRTGRADIEAAAQGVLDYESGKQSEAWGVTPVFPLVAERVRDMLVALERDGFVSFG